MNKSDALKAIENIGATYRERVGMVVVVLSEERTRLEMDARALGATQPEIDAAILQAGPLGEQDWLARSLIREQTLGMARQAIVTEFTRYSTFSAETAGHYRDCYVVIGGTAAQWEADMLDARMRWWRLRNLVTGETKEYRAVSHSGALTQAGWQLAECEVSGPHMRSTAEREAGWDCSDPDDMPDPTTEAQAYDDWEMERGIIEDDPDGHPIIATTAL